MWLMGRWPNLLRTLFTKMKSMAAARIHHDGVLYSKLRVGVPQVRRKTTKSHGDVGQLRSKRGHDSISVSDWAPWERDLGEDVIYFLLLTTFVIAWRITVPAFSISFLVKPMVTHTLSAGGTICFGWKLSSRDLRRLIRTPFARH
jgi:hypothetical protein